MKNRVLALLLVLAVSRSASAGPVEISVLPETTAAPLGSFGAAALAPIAGPGAPVPALSATAAPMLAAPAPSLNFAPALAPAAAPVAAPATIAAPAVAAMAESASPASAVPPTSARAAAPSARGAAESAAARDLDAGAVFDGGGARSPAAAAAARDEFSSGPAARPAPPTDGELATLFAAAMPNSPAIAVFDRMGSFAEGAQEITSHYTFAKEHLLEGVASSPQARGPRGAAFVQAVKDLVTVADARQDPASRRFLEALGRAAAYRFFLQQRMVASMTALGMFLPGPGSEGRNLPRNALGSGDYWDMAAGLNAGRFIMNELEPGTHYSFFDYSPFVVSYLQTVAELQGADVSVVEEDIRQLKRPAHPLAVLRTKNAVAYVPDFENKLEEMADWVAPGGRLVLQNDPVNGQRELIIEKHGPLALRLLREGWDLSIEFESQRGAEHSLDTLIFTRPKTAARTRTPAEAKAAWLRYIAAARKANQAGMLRFFFR